MRDRRRHQKPITGSHLPIVADLADQRVHRVMAVQDSFRAAGGSRCVKDHPHRIGIQRRQLHRRRVRRRQRRAAADHDNLGRRIHFADHPIQHLRVVVRAEMRWYENHPGIRVFEDEEQLAIPQRRQDRVHYHSGHRRGQVNDRGLMPIRQHHRHHAAGWHAGHQRLCEGRGLFVEASAVDLVRTVDQHNSLRCALRGLDQRVS